MAKKRPQQATAKKTSAPRKMTETILDFGRPLIERLGRDSKPETVHDMFQIIIIVWNAYVRAMPAWGHPESLQNLRELANDESNPELLRYAFGILTLRRVERFAHDARAVGDWAVSLNPDDGELKFGCQAVLPPSSDDAKA